MGRTCEPCMKQRSAWWRTRAGAKGQLSCSATPTAITAITSATSSVPTTGRKRWKSTGSRSAIPSSCWRTGWLSRGWLIMRHLSGSSKRCRPKSRRESNLPSTHRSQTRTRWIKMSTHSSATMDQNTNAGLREVTLGQAIREALAEEMRRDPRVFIMGEDVAEAGTAFKVLSGLVQEFGPSRVIDTPISEAGITGLGIGGAMTGMRPVVDIMFGDFIGLAMDQIVNQAAKVHYMSGGKLRVPLVVRTTLGATRRTAAQHSQSLQAWVSHVPGLKVALPSTPYDAKGLLKTAIRDDNPVIFFEDKMMYQLKGLVPEGDYTIPFGVADIKRAGTDITIVATSSMVQIALAAAELLEKLEISAEVVDPRTTFPLDKETLIESAKKTSRAIVMDEGYEQYGVTAELAAVIAEGAFYYLDAPVKRMGALDVPVPFSPVLEDLTVPTAATVVEAAKTLCGRV